MNAFARRRPRGFTLIEMIVTLSVFLLLAASVFGIFSATLESAAGLQDNQAREDRADAMGAWLKRQFLSLPADGVIAAYHRDGSPFHVSYVIWGTGDDLKALDVHQQPDGHYLLRLATAPAPESSGPTATATRVDEFARQVLNDDPPLPWRPLLRDLVSADWRFRAANAPAWQDVTSGDRQSLVEFHFQVAGTDASVTDDCWVPPLDAPTEPPFVPEASVTTNP